MIDLLAGLGYVTVALAFFVFLFLLWPEVVLLDFSPFEGDARFYLELLAQGGVALQLGIAFELWCIRLLGTDSMFITLIAVFSFLYVLSFTLCCRIVYRALSNP